jgi:alpha-tubulin suppressor-like RCC1 family protein
MHHRSRLPGLLALLFLVGVLAFDPADAQTASSSPPAEVGTADWRQVAAGGGHTCGVRTTGRLYCWGSGAFGALGYGDDEQQATPIEVAGNLTTWATVSAGYFHTCGLRTDHHLFCWGYGDAGRLGNGGTTQQNSPVEVDGAHADWIAVSAGGSHTCGVRTNHRAYCWGSDAFGQLGDGGASSGSSIPVEVAGNHADWTAISTGFVHTCGRRSNGRLYCWGRDLEGQVGNGSPFAGTGSPALVAGGITDWTSVAAAGYHTCARRANGRAYCWGEDDDGEVGNGPPYADRPAPTLVAGGFTNWASVTGGLDHSCGRRANGRLYCWGKDFDGQLGRAGGTSDQASPAEVAGGVTTWAAVSGGQLHTCARRSTGRIYCWGYNASAQLGIGSAGASRQTPVEVSA